MTADDITRDPEPMRRLTDLEPDDADGALSADFDGHDRPPLPDGGEQGLDQRRYVTADASEAVESLVGEEFDLVFLDADRPPLVTYLEWALRLVRPGGLIVAHNALLAGIRAGIIQLPSGIAVWTWWIAARRSNAPS